MSLEISHETPAKQAITQILSLNQVQTATLQAFFFAKNSFETKPQERLDQVLPISVHPSQIPLAAALLQEQARVVIPSIHERHPKLDTIDGAIGLNNLVFANGQIMCLPMIDFVIEIDELFKRNKEIEEMLINGIKPHLGSGILVSTGFSYHAYGLSLVTWPEYSEMLNRLGKSKISSTLDKRFIANTLSRRFSCLRLLPSIKGLKPVEPFVVSTYG
jgi:hypothetical protein